MLIMKVSIIFVVMTVAGVCRLTDGQKASHPGRSTLFELSILHINDFHARFEEVDPTGQECHKGRPCVGGIARLSTAVNDALKKQPNAIFLNAGDHYQGTLWCNIHRWNATADFMNMLPHDAMTIGNHEFDYKIAGLVPFLNAVKAPVVVCNLDFRHEPSMKNLISNSKILHRNGTKIGVIGVIIRGTPGLSNTEKLIFLDEIESVNLEATKLKNNNKVDIIIVLSHCGLPVDLDMAAKCPLVDVIVGGHSHTFLYSGIAPSIDPPAGTYPIVVTQASSNRTVLVVQAAAFTKYLGNLTVWFDKNGEVADWDGNPIPLNDSIPEDPKILNALVPWKAAVDAYAATVVAKTRVELQNNCIMKECNFGNLISDAMVDAWVSRADNDADWTYAAIAMVHMGEIRAGIDSTNGNITLGNLASAMPFENTFDVVEVQGQFIKKTLESSAWYAWAGLQVTFNTSLQVSHISVRCRTCDVPIYQPLVNDQWYRVVVSSHRVLGLKKRHWRYRNHIVGEIDLDVMIRFLKNISPIFYGEEGRRITY